MPGPKMPGHEGKLLIAHMCYSEGFVLEVSVLAVLRRLGGVCVVFAFSWQ